MCWALNWARSARDHVGSGGGPGDERALDVRINIMVGDAADTCDAICALSSSSTGSDGGAGGASSEGEVRKV